MKKLTGNDKVLSPEQRTKLLGVLKNRFEKNMDRHKNIVWVAVQAKLETAHGKLWSLNEMEATGGEPDVIGYDEAANAYVFCDCSAESPKGRRSVCYDHEALEARKEFKPAHSAVAMAEEMGIDLLTEQAYRALQQIGSFDNKTSSWLKTPTDIRALGGAIFGDYRFGHVFVYHNGAESYYAARGFRGSLTL